MTFYKLYNTQKKKLKIKRKKLHKKLPLQTDYKNRNICIL